MKPMKLAEVRKHTGCRLTVEEAAQYVSPGPIRHGNSQPGLRSVAAFLVELAERLAAARSLHRARRRQATPEMTRRLHEASMSPQTAQAFLDGLPRMRAALLNSRRILGLVAYAPAQARARHRRA